MVNDFHNTLLQIVREMTDDRRQFRKINVDMAARAGHQFTIFGDKTYLQQAALLDFAPDSREAWRMAAEVHGKLVKEAGWKEAWQRSLTKLPRAFLDAEVRTALPIIRQEELEHFLRVFEAW
eukprot:5487298-Alexandrium_andersonii.AAC.1